jgi:hypothetical protein
MLWESYLVVSGRESRGSVPGGVVPVDLGSSETCRPDCGLPTRPNSSTRGLQPIAVQQIQEYSDMNPNEKFLPFHL